MTQEKRFYRKIMYIVIIAVLIIPLYLLGNPAQKSPSGKLIRGGQLARMRDAHGLAEVNLGQIDPASSTMKLATFGMRGVAIALLWNRSLEYEKRADWNNVVATGNQIIMLEPHFITIWDFVGWKLAYNASAQFDDYRERYRWVIRGFEFLQNGTRYNQTAPRLFSKAGWTISQKIGIADEKDQYRRLFREDEDFHSRQIYKERDNWLFGRNYYLRAEELFEMGGSIGNETRAIFYSRSRMNLLHYAEWMEIDGCGTNMTNTPVFDEEHAAAAWKTAEVHWKEFCKKEMQTTIEDKTKPGTFRRTSLNRYHETKAEIEANIKKLEAMLPKGENRYTIAWERWNKELSEQQRASILKSLLDPAPADHYSLGEADRPYRIIREFLDGKHGPQPQWANWPERLAKAREVFYKGDLKSIAAIPSCLRDEADNLKLRTTEMQIGEWQQQTLALINVTPQVLADRIKGDASLEAKDICDRITWLEEEARFSGMFRDIMDSNRHEKRVVVEQQPEARKARDYRYQVRITYRAGQHEECNKAFLNCMASWMKLTARPEFASILKMPQFVSEFTNEVEKYVIVLDQLERMFPADYPFKSIVTESPGNKLFAGEMQEGIAYVQKLYDEKQYERSRDLAEKLVTRSAAFIGSSEVGKLGALPDISNAYLQSVKLYVTSWEKIGGKKFEEFCKTGALESYEGKNFLELYVNKTDGDYQEIRREEMLAISDPGKVIDHLQKAVELWGKVLVKYPVLRYDASSEFRPQIQAVANAFITERKKKSLGEPKDFPLKDFLH
ncbi:MAG: hypothetical protein PHQ75_11630 [Thermoguttaceae bacterium]|nr:hypothetical protein [Thermoguttaceae bacterium]